MKKGLILVLFLSLILLLNGCSDKVVEEKTEGMEEEANIAEPVAKEVKKVELGSGGGGFSTINIEYEEYTLPTSIDGEIAFITYDENEMFVVYGGEEIRNNYQEVDLLSDISGKVAFVAFDGEQEFVYFNGEEIKNDYAAIDSISEINGNLVFVGIKEDGDYLYYNGKEYGPFTIIDSSTIIDIKGKLAFLAEKDGKEVVFYDGRIVSEGYDLIEFIDDFDGKLFYVGLKGDEEFLVLEN
jgi:hypothetical protein